MWTHCRRHICLTGLHVEQQVLAVLLGLLDVLLQLSPLARREHGALFAVGQEVGQLGVQVIQDLLPLCGGLTADLTGEAQWRDSEWEDGSGTERKRSLK